MEKGGLIMNAILIASWGKPNVLSCLPEAV